MTLNDEVPQEVSEALESFAFFSDDRKTVLRRVNMVRDYITTLCAKLEAAEGEVARLREEARRLADKWQRIGEQHGPRTFTGNDHLLFANELRAALQEHTP